MFATILCVDKRQRNLMVERQLFEAVGCNVFAAGDCEEAWQLLRDHPVDVILVSDDVSASEYATCAKLRRLQPSACIVLQRASFDKPTAPADADLVIPKTTPPRQKVSAIASLVTVVQRAA